MTQPLHVAGFPNELPRPFTASIEVTEGVSHQHGFHLGTDEKIARSFCKDIYQMRVKAGKPVVTIGLMQEGKLVDCFYGDRWHWDNEDATQIKEGFVR